MRGDVALVGGRRLGPVARRGRSPAGRSKRSSSGSAADDPRDAIRPDLAVDRGDDVPDAGLEHEAERLEDRAAPVPRRGRSRSRSASRSRPRRRARRGGGPAGSRWNHSPASRWKRSTRREARDPQLGRQRGEDLELGGGDDRPEPELGRRARAARPGTAPRPPRRSSRSAASGSRRPAGCRRARRARRRSGRRTRSAPRRRGGSSVRRPRARARARRRSAGRAPGAAAAARRGGRRARPHDTPYSCQNLSCSRRSPSAAGSTVGRQIVAVERVAVGRVAALVAGREPLLALRRTSRASRSRDRPGPGVASWMRSSPTAAAASSASAISASVNGSRKPVLAAWFAHTPAKQSAWSSVRTERLSAPVSPPPPPCSDAEEVLDVVAVLVGDDIALGERAALRAEARRGAP